MLEVGGAVGNADSTVPDALVGQIAWNWQWSQCLPGWAWRTSERTTRPRSSAGPPPQPALLVGLLRRLGLHLDHALRLAAQLHQLRSAGPARLVEQVVDGAAVAHRVLVETELRVASAEAPCRSWRLWWP